MAQLLNGIDATTMLALITLFTTVTMQLIGFGKIIGSVNVKLSMHEEQHIRHQTRIDEHARLISEHDRDLAVLKDRRTTDKRYGAKNAGN